MKLNSRIAIVSIVGATLGACNSEGPRATNAPASAPAPATRPDPGSQVEPRTDEGAELRLHSPEMLTVQITGPVQELVNNAELVLAEKRVARRAEGLAPGLVRCGLSADAGRAGSVRAFLVKDAFYQGKSIDATPGKLKIDVAIGKDTLTIQCEKDPTSEFTIADLLSATEGYLDFALPATE